MRLCEELEGNLDQGNQSIDINKQLHSIETLSKTFHKPVGEADPYEQFRYCPQTI